MRSLLLLAALVSAGPSARQQLDDCAAGACWGSRPNLTVDASAGGRAEPLPRFESRPDNPAPKPPPGEIRFPKEPTPEQDHKIHRAVFGGAGAFVGYLAAKGAGIGALGGLLGAVVGGLIGLGVAYLIYKSAKKKG